MASFVFTSGTNSYTFSYNGNVAEFDSGDIKPSIPANGGGRIVRLRDVNHLFNTLGNAEKEIIKIDLDADSVEVDGATVWADALALFQALKPVFFLSNSSGGNPAIPADQVVDLFSNLPTPAGDYGRQYWIVDQTETSGIWPFRTVKSKGIYKSVAGAWDYRGADVPEYLVDENLQFTDDVTGHGLGFQLAALTADRRANWPDKNGTVAFIDDIPSLPSILENQTLFGDGLGGYSADYLRPNIKTFPLYANEGETPLNYTQGFGCVIDGWGQGLINRIGAYVHQSDIGGRANG